MTACRIARRSVVALATLTLVAAAPALQAGRRGGAVPDTSDDRVLLHVLNRLTFGPRPGDLERVRALGLHAFIEQQLAPDRIANAPLDARLAGFETLGKSSRQIAGEYVVPAMEARRRQQQAAARDDAMAGGGGTGAPPAPEPSAAPRGPRVVMAELSEQKLLRAIYSERQLQEVLTDFWFNHFNVFAAKGATAIYVHEYEREAIRPHVLGRFRDLLGATARSPAMLFYLDNWQNAAPPGAPTLQAVQEAAARGRAAGMRRLREQQRLADGGPATPARGVRPSQPAMPRPAPAPGRPRGINENYARELMELHTLGVDGGYTQRDVQEVARAFTGWTLTAPRQGGGFRFDPRMHDAGEKTVLGHRIPAGGGQSDGERVLDILAEHPATARFVATKLARRFVSDTPPPALVERASRRFLETHGDLREVVRTIVTSPEFFAPEAFGAKVKSPLEFVVSAVRAIGAQPISARPLVASMRELGMPLYLCQPPTGYADWAEAWVNTGALLARMNVAVALTGGRNRGRGPAGPPDTASVDAVVRDAFAGHVSAITAATVARADEPRQALALLLGSPDFQKR